MTFTSISRSKFCSLNYPYLQLRFKVTKNSQVALGQVEGHTALDVVAVLKVAEKSDCCEKYGDHRHSNVQHAPCCSKLFGLFHFVLKRQHLQIHINFFNADAYYFNSQKNKKIECSSVSHDRRTINRKWKENHFVRRIYYYYC
jgi:hypothetical protein